MMSMYGFETGPMAHTDYRDAGTNNSFRHMSRLVFGVMLAVVSLYGVAHSFDPVTLSVVQVFFMITTILGVAIAALWQE